MTNQIYIPDELTETLQRLPKDQTRRLVQTIDSLQEHVLENSHFVSTGGAAKGHLREAQAGALRILFQYTPENHSIIITEVSRLAPTPLDTPMGIPASA